MERGTGWHLDPPPAVGTLATAASDPEAFTTFARDLGADERYRFIDVLDIDAPPKRALAFVVCYPTGVRSPRPYFHFFAVHPHARSSRGRRRRHVRHGRAAQCAPERARCGTAGDRLAGDRPSAAAVLAAPARGARQMRRRGGKRRGGRRQGRHFVALVKVADLHPTTERGAGPSAPVSGAEGREAELRKLVMRLDARPDACFPSWRWSTPRRGRDRDVLPPPRRGPAAGTGAAGAAGDAPLAPDPVGDSQDVLGAGWPKVRRQTNVGAKDGT